MSVERLLVRGIVVVLVEGAVAAERQYTHCEKLTRLLALALEKRGTEAYREFLDLEPEQASREIMPELVDGDHDHEPHEREQDIADVSEHFGGCGGQSRGEQVYFTPME